MTTVDQRHIEYLPLADIPRAERNPKAHNLTAIRRSLNMFGCTWAGLLDERTSRLVAGHGRLAALQEMYDSGQAPPAGITEANGVWLVPIVRGWSSRSDSEAEAYLVADNRLSEMGGWDNRELTEVLADLADTPELLEASGYTNVDLDDLVATLGDPPTLDDLEDEFGTPADGDLWPVLRFKVPPHIRAAFYELTDPYDEDDDDARFIRLIERAQQSR